MTAAEALWPSTRSDTSPGFMMRGNAVVGGARCMAETQPVLSAAAYSLTALRAVRRHEIVHGPQADSVVGTVELAPLPDQARSTLPIGFPAPNLSTGVRYILRRATPEPWRVGSWAVVLGPRE